MTKIIAADSTTQPLSAITCGCGEGHTDLSKCDAWDCSCGNAISEDGFFPCNRAGEEVEPTEAAWPEPLYVCGRCSTIFNQGTGEAVGRAEV